MKFILGAIVSILLVPGCGLMKSGKSEDQKVVTLESIEGYSSPREAPPLVSGVAGACTSSDSWFAGAGHPW